MIDGKLRQVMLSARELNSASLPNRTWVNERLTFTHGYGLTLGPVNEVTSEGLPVLFVRDLPPVTIPDLTIDEPSLYFGELSNDYVIVRTEHAGVPLPARRRQRRRPATTARRGCRSTRCGASCSSRCASARIRSSSTTTSAPRAASCSTATSASASRRSRRSWRSTGIRTW